MPANKLNLCSIINIQKIMKKTVSMLLLIISTTILASCHRHEKEHPQIMCEFTLSGDTLYHTHRNLDTNEITDGPDSCEFYQEALKIFTEE